MELRSINLKQISKGSTTRRKPYTQASGNGGRTVTGTEDIV